MIAVPLSLKLTLQRDISGLGSGVAATGTGRSSADQERSQSRFTMGAAGSPTRDSATAAAETSQQNFLASIELAQN
jgi:hypothetical protein